MFWDEEGLVLWNILITKCDNVIGSKKKSVGTYFIKYFYSQWSKKKNIYSILKKPNEFLKSFKISLECCWCTLWNITVLVRFVCFFGFFFFLGGGSIKVVIKFIEKYNHGIVEFYLELQFFYSQIYEKFV